MTDGVGFRLEGLDRLQKAFKGLDEEVSIKGANAAARAAARVIARAAHRNALKLDDPASAEQIARNIWVGGARYPGVRKKSKRRTPEGEVHYRVGVAGGARQYANTAANRRSGKVGKTYATLGDKNNPGGDTFYWRFLEFGTQNVKATPFLRPAAKQSEREAISVFIDEYEKGVKRAVKRAQRR